MYAVGDVTGDMYDELIACLLVDGTDEYCCCCCCCCCCRCCVSDDGEDVEDDDEYEAVEGSDMGGVMV